MCDYVTMRYYVVELICVTKYLSQNLKFYPK
jgi:hypothetical protein